MIVNEAPEQTSSPSQPNEGQMRETSSLLDKSRSKDPHGPPKPNLIGKFIFSWRKLKESATDFLDSNTEIYNNVTSTVNDLEVNEGLLHGNSRRFVSEQVIAESSQNEHSLRPELQTPNSYTNIAYDQSFLSFKNMKARNSFKKSIRLFLKKAFNWEDQLSGQQQGRPESPSRPIPQFKERAEPSREVNCLSEKPPHLQSQHLLVSLSSSISGPLDLAKTQDGCKHKFFMFCNVFRVFVACGALIIPFAVSICGIVPSALMFLLVSLLTTLNHHYLDAISKRLPAFSGLTLETISGIVYGNKMKKLVLFLITGSQLCAFIGSFILATELFHHSLCGSFSSDIECISRTTVASYMALLNIFMVFVPNLRMFGYISSLSVIFQFFALVAVFFYATKLLLHQEDLPSEVLSRVAFMDWTALLQTLSVILYVFQRITFYLPIRANYSKMSRFHRFYVACMNGIFGFIFLMTLPIYFNFFQNAQEIVFQNFDSSFHVVEFFKLAYSVVIFLSNPINLFPIYNSVYSIKCVEDSLSQKGAFSKYALKFLIRMLVTLLGIAVGIYVKSFVGFCSFVGSFFFSFLGLVLPGLLVWKFLEEAPAGKVNWPKFRVILVVSLGVCIFAVTSVFSFIGLITSNSISI